MAARTATLEEVALFASDEASEVELLATLAPRALAALVSMDALLDALLRENNHRSEEGENHRGRRQQRS